MNMKINLIINNISVGYGILELDNKELGFISGVKIYKKYRNNGYGTKLINKIVKIAINIKLTKLYLHVRYDNFNAINMYKKNLFTITKKNYDNKILFGYTMSRII